MNNPQVGGVYPVKDREGLSFRVLAFDDTQVKILHVQGDWEYGETTISRHYFDKVTFPEDHGPIPDLVASLQFVKQWLANLEDASEPGDPLYAMRKKYHAPIHAEIDAALAKVKTAAVPDSEEVAA